MTSELAPWIERARGSGLMGPRDEARVRFELWEILERKADALALGDSSIKAEQAEELARSVCFAISQALGAAEPAEAGRRLLLRPLKALYREGMDRIWAAVDRAKAAYERALREALPFDNLAWRDTLENLGGFFKRYRPDLFAHDIPCMIDYPLFRPAEGLGVRYIEAYLAEWSLENDFLRAFGFRSVERLLAAHLTDPREQVVNLFEPVAVNALGLTLLGRDPAGLSVAPEDAARLMRGAGRMTGEALDLMLRAAADRLSGRLDVGGPHRALARSAARSLAARLAALPPEAAPGLFPSFQSPRPSGR